MKKILRLVTTSVLTLTLVACGGTSSEKPTTTPSSQKPTTSTTQPTSGSSHEDVKVTSVAIETTGALTQEMGSTSKVTIRAKFNTGANPTAVEWYVNDEKQSQTATTFDYQPKAAGAFVIKAKVGSVVSNELTINVAEQKTPLDASDPVVVDADTIEIAAQAGATVAVSGHELKDSSRFSLKDQKYVLELDSALKQGETVTVTLSKGDDKVTKSFVYDLEKLEVKVAGAKKEDDGTYTVTKPFYTDPKPIQCNITWTPVEMTGTKSVSFSATAPEGATAMGSTSGNQEIAALTKTFNVTKDTVPGTYTFTHKVGDKETVATILVKEPEAELKITEHTVTGADGKKFKSLLLAQKTGETAQEVKPEADGSYTITKPYLKATGIALSFNAKAKNIDIPDALNRPGNLAEPNRIKITVANPSGDPYILVDADKHAQTMGGIYIKTIRDATKTAGEDYTANVDYKTPAGQYTFTVEVFTSASGDTAILSKQIVVNVKDPAPKLSFKADQLNDATGNNHGQELIDNKDGTYTIGRPAAGNDAQTIVMNATLENYESPRFTGQVGIEDAYDSDYAKVFYAFKGEATAPETEAIKGQAFNTKIAIELDQTAANTISGEKPGTPVDGNVWYDAQDNQVKKYDAANTKWVAMDDADGAHDVNAIVYNDGKQYRVIEATTTNDTWDNSGLDAAKNGLADWTATPATAYTTSSQVFHKGFGWKVKTTATAAPTADKWDDAEWEELDTFGTSTHSEGDRIWHKGKCYRATVATTAATFKEEEWELNTPKVAKLGFNAIAGDEYKDNKTGIPADKAAYARFLAKDAKVELNNVFRLKVDSKTSLGAYAYTVQVGEHTKTVTINVVEPKSAVEFKVSKITALQGKNDPDETKDEFKKMQKKNEYTFVYDTGDYLANFTLGINNMKKPTPETASDGTQHYYLPYTISVLTPAASYEATDVIEIEDKPGKDGHIRAMTPDSTKPEENAIGNIIGEMDGHNGTAGVLEITEDGDYIVTLTIAGETKTITIHAKKDASLKVHSVYDAGNHVYLEEAKGSYLVSKKLDKNVTYNLEVAVSGINLPSKVYYFVDDTPNPTTAPTGKAVKELKFKDGVATVETEWTLKAATTGTTPTLSDENTDRSLHIWLYSDKEGKKPIGSVTRIPLFDLYVE